MSWTDAIGGLLKQYSGQNVSAADAETHFDQVTNVVPSSALGPAVSDMLRSSRTPPFAQLAAQMFGSANGAQKASVLNELLSAAGPALPSILSGAGLGGLASNLGAGGTITPEAAQQVPPEVVQQVVCYRKQVEVLLVRGFGLRSFGWVGLKLSVRMLQ